MTNLAYLSLGSNINPAQNIRRALTMLALKTDLLAVSSFWETEPFGMTGQSNFLNGAAVVKTPLSARRLKRTVLHPIERRLGRTQLTRKWASRTIDLDLIFFNRDRLRVGPGVIPHPDALRRAFVAIPLAEIAPDYRHPVTGQSLQEIARRFEAELNSMRRCNDLLNLQKIAF
ncbi:MAG: 2-amino-4-hydroxy-6-hydroxymethyldihydropteridine diphosphokinase [Anaerolineae bacterium]